MPSLGALSIRDWIWRVVRLPCQGVVCVSVFGSKYNHMQSINQVYVCICMHACMYRFILEALVARTRQYRIISFNLGLRAPKPPPYLSGIYRHYTGPHHISNQLSATTNDTRGTSWVSLGLAEGFCRKRHGRLFQGLHNRGLDALGFIC